MTANDDGFVPAGDKSRDIRDDDWLTENHTAKNVADCAVRALPHFLELEFLHAVFVRCDCGALHANAVLFDRVRRIDGDLVVGLVALLNRKVVVLEC